MRKFFILLLGVVILSAFGASAAEPLPLGEDSAVGELPKNSGNCTP